MDDEKQMDRVQKIPLTELIPFKDHPFKVVEGRIHAPNHREHFDVRSTDASDCKAN